MSPDASDNRQKKEKRKEKSMASVIDKCRRPAAILDDRGHEINRRGLTFKVTSDRQTDREGDGEAGRLTGVLALWTMGSATFRRTYKRTAAIHP
jgi:hypothetical protein